MANGLIIFRSVTYAQRASRVLAQNGISSTMIKPQASLAGGSCAHALKVSPNTLQRAAALLRTSQIPFTQLYATDRFGNYVLVN